MFTEFQTYLNVDEQQDIKNKLRAVTKQASLSEKYFYEYGNVVSLMTLVASNVVFFRCGFRAYNMYKYNRGRFITPLMSSLVSVQGCAFHTLLVKDKIEGHFRTENKWYYGLRSLYAHQLGAALCFTFCIGTTFLNAQLNGMIPIRAHFFRNSTRKMEGIKYAIKKLKPHTRAIALTWLLSSALMFKVGTLEYEQSCNLLAKLNRKTISYKED